MHDFVYHSPTKVFFGKRVEQQVGPVLAEAGFRKVLIHFGGGSVRSNGLLATVEQSLLEAGIVFVEYGGVSPNPKIEMVREGIQIAEREHIDMILAVGGGSVIDSAKGIGLGLAHHKDPWEMIEKGEAPTATFPLAAVLTISAAGSEMSYSDVLTNSEKKLKRAMNNDLLRPLFAFENPEYTKTVGPYQSACGIVDIMMHTLERYLTGDKDTELTDRLGEALLVSVKHAGEVVMSDPSDYEARATLMWASSLSHNGITGCGKKPFFPAHKLEHDISGLHDEVSHGAGLAVVFPAWARYVYTHDVRKFAQLAERVWNVEMDHDHPERTALGGIEAMVRYFKRIGMPTTMRELGIDPSEFRTLAEMTTDCDRKPIPSYIPLGVKEIVEIYKSVEK